VTRHTAERECLASMYNLVMKMSAKNDLDDIPAAQFLKIDAAILLLKTNPRFDITALRRTVERLLQIPLSSLILSGRFKEHKSWQVVCAGGGVSIISMDSGCRGKASEGR
ncbi:MAG: hypothetical protein AAB197_05760, partial [Deltaproteobacteria bacterium]